MVCGCETLSMLSNWGSRLRGFKGVVWITEFKIGWGPAGRVSHGASWSLRCLISSSSSEGEGKKSENLPIVGSVQDALRDEF